MQNTKFLTEKEIQILDYAKRHIKKTYKDGLIPIEKVFPYAYL